MPELPEVETLRRSLVGHLVGHRLVAVTVREARLREEVDRDGLAACCPATIKAVGRRAKYLLLHLDRDRTLLFHLGMSGRLVVEPPGAAWARHDPLRLWLDDGRLLTYHDPRRFGRLVVATTSGLADHPLLAHLGPEPLGPDLTAANLARAAAGRSRPIKPFLMDGRGVVGVGNIYACESLFMAGIHPATAAGRIRPVRWERLVAAIQTVLAAAIAAGGTTLRDFADADGRGGLYQLHTRVYGHAGEPCQRCGRTIRHTVQTGRATFYCPGCQH